MGKLVCPYCRTEATDAIGVKRREPRQKHYVFGMAEPYYMHSEGVPYSKKDSFKPKGGKNPPACSPVSAGSSSTPSNGRSIATPVTPWLQMHTAPEMCSSHSHGFGLRPLMFAQRHIFFRLRAFISGCLAALANSHLQLCCLVDMVLGTGSRNQLCSEIGVDNLSTRTP